MVDERIRRIAVVGPVTPYRSGIAKHTTELARALARRDDVECRVFSYASLYPRLLYPGDSDRAADAAPLAAPPARYGLNSVDPLSWRRAIRDISRFAPDLVVMPAWTFFVAPSLGAVARAFRRRGVPVVAIVHNAADHEAAGWKARLSAFQLRQASAYVTHNTGLADELREALAGIVAAPKIFVHPHPIFDQYPEPAGRLARGAPLELLFFGLVRPYKGLDIALRAVAAARRRDLMLRVVGEFWSGLDETKALVADLGIADRVEIVARYVSDAEAAEFFARADAVLLPYRTVSGSGVVPVAYRYGKPVIVSDLPGLTEVVEAGETGWVVPAGDADALAARLDESVSAEAAGRMGPAIARMRARMSWESFAAAVMEAGFGGVG